MQPLSEPVIIQLPAISYTVLSDQIDLIKSCMRSAGNRKVLMVVGFYTVYRSLPERIILMSLLLNFIDFVLR
jgi:hypothetical protein